MQPLALGRGFLFGMLASYQLHLSDATGLSPSGQGMADEDSEVAEAWISGRGHRSEFLTCRGHPRRHTPLGTPHTKGFQALRLSHGPLPHEFRGGAVRLLIRPAARSSPPDCRLFGLFSRLARVETGTAGLCAIPPE